MVQARLRTARILFAALLASLLVYAVVVHLLAWSVGWRGTVGEPALTRLRRVLLGLGAAVFAGTLVARARLLGPDGLVALARRAGTEAALVQLQTRTVIVLALMESVAIFGLVLFLIGGRLADFYPLWGLGVLGQLLAAPRRQIWEEIGRAAPRR